MIIELKDKFDIDSEVSDFNIHIIKNEVSMALDSLGYTKVKIEDYITNDEIEKLSDSGHIMKEILKKIASKR